MYSSSRFHAYSRLQKTPFSSVLKIEVLYCDRYKWNHAFRCFWLLICYHSEPQILPNMGSHKESILGFCHSPVDSRAHSRTCTCTPAPICTLPHTPTHTHTHPDVLMHEYRRENDKSSILYDGWYLSIYSIGIKPAIGESLTVCSQFMLLDKKAFRLAGLRW